MSGNVITLELDFMWDGSTREQLDEQVDAFCEKWKLGARILQANGPGGGAAVIDFVGPLTDMIRMLLAPEGYGLDFEDCVWHLSGCDDSIYEVKEPVS